MFESIDRVCWRVLKGCLYLSIVHIHYGLGDGWSVRVIVRRIPKSIDGLETENLRDVMFVVQNM